MTVVSDMAVKVIKPFPFSIKSLLNACATLHPTNLPTGHTSFHVPLFSQLLHTRYTPSNMPTGHTSPYLPVVCCLLQATLHQTSSYQPLLSQLLQATLHLT